MSKADTRIFRGCECTKSPVKVTGKMMADDENRPPSFLYEKEGVQREKGNVSAAYFIGAIIGAYVVLQTAPDLLTFIGAPTATTVDFFCWRAKNENINKHADATADPAIMGENIRPHGADRNVGRQ